MSLVVAFIGALIVMLGVYGLASPRGLVEFVSALQTRAGLWAAALIRVVFGIALILAAPDSRAPDVIRVLGWFVLVAGIVTPMVGLRRTGALLAWWSRRPDVVLRAWAGVVVLFGIAIVWVVVL